MSGHKKEVAVKAEASPALIDHELEALFIERAGDGNENVTQDDLSTPLVRILQENSPVAKRSSPDYIPGMMAGMFFNSLTRQSYGEVMFFVPCFFSAVMMEWKPNQGGLVGIYPLDNPRVTTIKTTVNDQGKRVDYFPDTMNDAVLVHQHFILACTDVETNNEGHLVSYRALEPAIFGLSSTQLKRSRALNTILGSQLLLGSDGKPRVGPGGVPVSLPRYGSIVRAATVIETRDKNSWYGVSFGLERRVTAPELRQAMAFKDLAASNQVKANLSDLSEDKDGSPGHPRAAAPGSAVPDDEIPF